jgi:hypothetical protein
MFKGIIRRIGEKLSLSQNTRKNGGAALFATLQNAGKVPLVI